MNISTWMAFSLLISPAATSSVERAFVTLPVGSAQSTVIPKAFSTLAQSAETESNAEIIRLIAAGSAAYWEADDVASAEYYQQALELIERKVERQASDLEEPDIWLKVQALHGVGRAYGQMQNYDLATPPLEAALDILELDMFETVLETAPEQMEQASDDQVSDDQAGEDLATGYPMTYTDIKIDLYGMLGAIAKDTGGYATSLSYSRAALALAQANNRPEEVAIFHHNIGSIEADISQFENAQLSLQRAIELSQAMGMQDLEASAVFTLGWVEEREENFEQAIVYYQDAIALFSELRQQVIPDPPPDQQSPNQQLDQQSPDQQSDQQSGQQSDQQLDSELQNIIIREVRAHNNLGIVHLKQRNFDTAQIAFDDGFELLKQQDDPTERALLIDSVGSLFKAKGNLEQAWKSYLNAWQLSRQSNDTAGEIAVLLNLGELLNSQGESALAIFFYKQAVAQLETIRTDLRQLSQSVQQRYTRSVESAYRTLADLLLQQGREAEALQVLELLKLQEVKIYLHNAADGREAGAQTFNTPAEAALLSVLETLPTDTSLAEFIVHPAALVLKTPAESSQVPEDAAGLSAFSLQAVEALKSAIAQQPGTAALYPLILEDRLEVLLVTPTGTVERFTSPASQSDIHATVRELQSALRNKALDPTPAAQQLYRWLIQPLTETFTAEQIENIIYLPDGVLRYVPLAAFHDGDRWLIETYRAHTITAATIDDLTTQNDVPLGVMAGAFTDSSVVHRVDVGTRSFTYAGLSAAQQEVDNLQQALPNSAALLNQDFSPDSLLAGVGDRPILHLATHAQFIPGEPEDSFILFGDGRTVNLRQLQQWQLPNVDLVVLSACQTASSSDGDGKEILGLGYQIQATGAKAAIASLWAVDDVATAALMSRFYQHLSDGHTKAHALQLAQTDLIRSQVFSNPYDWAAFILIGNGL
ncbi:MAG: CHAT domain-containing protein [Cyanobacteria bacterium P01_D01_bin.105]